MVNGGWIGVISNAQEILRLIKKHKRNGLLPLYTSASWNIPKNELIIYTDSGRLCRPVFYVKNKRASFKQSEILEKINGNKFSWTDLISGFATKKIPNYDVNNCNIYDIKE